MITSRAGSYLQLPSAVLASFLALLLLMSCATSSDDQILAAVKEHHTNRQGHKAFAIARFGDGLWVVGWSHAQQSLDAARISAVENCNSAAREKGRTQPCRVLYENDRLIHLAVAQSPREQAPSTPPVERNLTPPIAPRQSTGSGLFVSSRGHVLTAEHVTRGATHIHVVSSSGRVFIARVVAANPRSDLAVLATDSNTDAFVPVVDAKPTLGMRVFTIGFPDPGLLGLAPKISDGIVSSTSGIQDDANYMQITIPIQPGNSGGPVFAEDGTLVGIVTSTAAMSSFLKRTGALPQNVNWASHASRARSMLPAQDVPPAKVTREEAIKKGLASVVLVRVTE